MLFTNLVAPFVISSKNTRSRYLPFVISKTLRQISNWCLNKFSVFPRIKVVCSDVEDYVAWVLFTNTKFCIIFHASDFCSWEIPNISIIIFVYFFDRFNSLMNFTILSPILYIFFLTPFWLLWPFPLVLLFVILTLLSLVTAFIQWFIYISCGHTFFNIGWSFIPIISGTSAFSYFISTIIGSFFASN